jgi:hypothetical protein
MGSTEEDIKLKVVYPLLRQLGFGDDELEFEESFLLRLGLFTYKVETKKQVETARSRLDILAKRDGRNLFIIEVKTDSKALTDDDRDQAVSYARLVHPMAPVAIVTNGKETKIYYTVDKNEIHPNKIDILGLTLEDDMLDHYEEAFQFFMGYSPENVQAFCQAQIHAGMKTLLGSKEEAFRKFKEKTQGQTCLLHLSFYSGLSYNNFQKKYTEFLLGNCDEYCEQLLQCLSSLSRLFDNHIECTSQAYRFAICLWLIKTSSRFVNNKKFNQRNIQKQVKTKTDRHVVFSPTPMRS